MRYHGNYCGPNWSGGQHQASVGSNVPPIDDFDNTCKVHDAIYAAGGDLDLADRTFVADNLAHLDPQRWLAAAAVGGQVLLRSVERLTTFHIPSTMKTHLRGASTPTPTVASQSARSPHLTQVSAPAALGSQIRGSGARTRNKTGNSVSLDVSVCIGRPLQATQTVVPEMLAVQYLMPVCLGNDEVQNMTRVYQNFRITRATIHFRPFQGTAAGGEVILVSNEDPNYRPVNTSGNASFYQRALTSKHSVLTPIWCPASMELAVDKRWKVCDNSNSTTLEEFCSGVVYAYSDGTALTVGYLLVDLSIEFEGLRFNSRNLLSGSFQGMGTRQTTTVPSLVSGSEVIMTGAGFTPGDLYAIQVSTSSMSLSVGLTASNMWAISSGTSTIPFTLTGSTLLYMRASTATAGLLYTTYDSAVGDDNSDKLLAATTNVSPSTFPTTLITQLRNSTQPGL